MDEIRLQRHPRSGLLPKGEGMLLWLVAIALVMGRCAVGAPKDQIKAIVEREYPALEKIYMGVHQAPEWSLMEEVSAGAKAMIAAGLFTKFPRPDYAIALHVDAELEVEKVGYISGYAMANVDSIDVLIRGVGGHGAMPHMTKDPIVIAAECVLALQTIASREVKATEPVVVTVGSIHGGTKHNVIPDEVKMQLTVRTYKDEVRQQVISAIEQIAKGCATAAGLPPDKMPEVNVLHAEHVNAVYNNPELTKRVKATLK